MTDPALHSFAAEKYREDFPILSREVRGKPLIYLDNAATTQKPRVVLDALAHYYEADNANVHRGVHLLSERATRAYEESRVKVARFLGAAATVVVRFWIISVVLSLAALTTLKLR